MAALPPAPPYLVDLLTYGYDAFCTPNRFCMNYMTPICSHCCPNHAAAHHGAQYRDPRCPEVRFAPTPTVKLTKMYGGFGHCVEYFDANRCGYKWEQIHRVRYGQEVLVPLHRRAGARQRPGRVRSYCNRCNDPMASTEASCSTECKLAVVDEGRPAGRAKAQAMVNADFHQRFFPDRFCTLCRRFYASAFCGTHAQSHHPGQGGEIIRFVRAQGMVLTPVAGVLPGHVVDGVQVIYVGGIPMVPILSPAVPADLESENMCPICYQVIGAGNFCSLHCKWTSFRDLQRWSVLPSCVGNPLSRWGRLRSARCAVVWRKRELEDIGSGGIGVVPWFNHVRL
ncbi:unnamed protein product [Triticum turgidum subsp. durum]|uniref:Uncharacterized protein n=1 Tax=Triticum turgidum subsp. durum TaxID=4567 RepID=A0A9R1QT91_TRITD|nr:unnamed protein product [Triticum turgidum subsp. durum]